MLFHYKEYIEKWDEIAGIFSPEAIRAGSLSEYVKSIKGKRGTADVDDDFLQEIERWRELLAKNIASKNDWIDISALNYAVQMIIDRIIFLRICEERSIEPENQLKDLVALNLKDSEGEGSLRQSQRLLPALAPGVSVGRGEHAPSHRPDTCIVRQCGVLFREGIKPSRVHAVT
jgi:hypothetical protein